MPTTLVTSRYLLYAFFIVLVTISPCLADEDDGFQEITAPETKLILEKGNAVLVNVLSSLEYELQHIPGSISIPINQLKTSTLLPKDKEKPLIFYCMGPR